MWSVLQAETMTFTVVYKMICEKCSAFFVSYTFVVSIFTIFISFYISQNICRHVATLSLIYAWHIHLQTRPFGGVLCDGFSPVRAHLPGTEHGKLREAGGETRTEYKSSKRFLVSIPHQLMSAMPSALRITEALYLWHSYSNKHCLSTSFTEYL